MCSSLSLRCDGCQESNYEPKIKIKIIAILVHWRDSCIEIRSVFQCGLKISMSSYKVERQFFYNCGFFRNYVISAIDTSYKNASNYVIR